jgi:hypothetical protein
MEISACKQKVQDDFQNQKPTMLGGRGPYFPPINIDLLYSKPAPHLIKRYNVKKAFLIDNAIPFEERIVYHGTYEENLESIFEDGFKVEKCGSRMQSDFGRGIYTSSRINVAIYYCFGGVKPENAYDTERSNHKLVACKILAVKEFKSFEYCTGWNPSQEYETFSYLSDDPHKSPQTVIYRDENILPLFIIQTKE